MKFKLIERVMIGAHVSRLTWAKGGWRIALARDVDRGPDESGVHEIVPSALCHYTIGCRATYHDSDDGAWPSGSMVVYSVEPRVVIERFAPALMTSMWLLRHLDNVPGEKFKREWVIRMVMLGHKPGEHAVCLDDSRIAELYREDRHEV